MNRNLKALGLALVAVLAMSGLVAQGASATTKEHQFSADGVETVVTSVQLNPFEFTVGTKGVVKCKKVQTESTQTGTPVGGTWETDTITVVPHYGECEFGGNPATVNFHHCAYVFYSDTTLGNPTGGEHATAEIECEGPENKVTLATSTCTMTFGPQKLPDAVRYENDTESSFKLITTAHEVEVSNLNDKAGCVLFPKGKVGKFINTTTHECFRDIGETITDKTAKTTPTGLTTEGETTKCSVTGA